MSIGTSLTDMHWLVRNFCGVLWLLPLAGCCAYPSYCYRTVTVTVRDAETGRVIPGAVVETGYNEALTHVAPRPSRGVTGEGGTTRVRVAKDPTGIFIHAEAKGYLDPWAGGVYPNGRPYVSSPYTELPAWPFDAVTLTLYAEPAPSVVLVVPDGYAGPIPVGRGYGRRGNPWPGRRVFEVLWEPGQTASLRGIPQMSFSPPTITHVRYVGGQEIPRGVPRTDGVGWWYTGAGVFIGTWDERHELGEAYRKAMRRLPPQRLKLEAK